MLKKFISTVTGTSYEEGDKEEPKQPEHTSSRSKSLDCKTRKPLDTDGKTLKSKKTLENNLDNMKCKLYQEAEVAFDKIRLHYSEYNCKFLKIYSNNDNNNKKEAILELIEDLDQLVFSLDKVEVENYQDLKDERRKLLKLVQNHIKLAKTKTQEGHNTVDEAKGENNVQDFFMFANNSFENLVYDEQNKLTNVLDTQVAHFSGDRNVGQHSSSHPASSQAEKVTNLPSLVKTKNQKSKSKNYDTKKVKPDDTKKGASKGKKVKHSNTGSQNQMSNTESSMAVAEHVSSCSKMDVVNFAVVVNPESGVRKVQAVAETSNEHAESMDFEMIEHDLQEFQDAVSDLPAAVNNLVLHHDNNTVSAVHLYTPHVHPTTRGHLNSGVMLAQPQLTRQPTMQAPIQLLIRNAEGLFDLNEAAVASILCTEEVKNRKIAILSVVGAFRRGKSFLLNFMLRYLKAQGHSDWLTQSDVVEGFSWRGGRERDTTGILMWPEVFLIGEDLALVLLDTQGTFDKRTSMKENTFIFALSTLLSSVQIYNLHERIQMDDLTNLQYFLEFGRMVQASCNDKVFQKLIFLIRDWKFDCETGYGFEEGNKELEDWFTMEHNRERAEMIQTCFKQVLCFLMPHPGDQVSRNQNFRGTLNEIEPEFLEQLKLLIETVLYPGHLAVKQIGGQCIRAQDFLVYMKNYVEKLQHPDMEPKTLFQSMSETCHEKAMSEAKHVYMQDMEAGLTDAAVDIQVLHQSALDTACLVFDSTPKFGSNYNTTSYRKKLVEYLVNELYGRYAREFDLHSESRFYAACNDIYETYQTTLTTFCMQLHHECTLEEKCAQACRHAVNTVANLTFKVPQHLRTSKLSELQKKMHQFFSLQVPHFQARQKFMQSSTRQQQYTDVKQKVVKCYQQTMDTYCGGPEPVPDFDLVHARAEVKAHEVLYADIEEYQLTNCNELQMEINKETDEICKRFRAHDKRKIEKKKEDKFQLLMVKCRQEVIDTYRRLMDDKCGGLKTVENIENVNKTATDDALSLFKPHFKTCANVCETYRNDAKKTIDNLFTTYKMYNEDKQKHNARERAYQLRDAAIRSYEEQMGLLQIGTNPVNNLQDKHEEIWNVSFEMLQPIFTSEYYTSALNGLSKTVSERFAYYTQMNNARLRQAELDHGKAKFAESIKYYQDKMDDLKIDVRPVDDLPDSHTLFKNEAQNILHEFSELEGYDTFIDRFNKEVDKKWRVYEEKNKKMHKLFKNDEKRTVMQAYNNMKTEYTSNMQRQMSAAVDTKNPSLLYQEHQKQRELCITNFQEMTRDCSEENKLEFLTKLQHDIQTSYEDIEETYAKNMRDLRVNEEKLRRGAAKTYVIGIDLGTTNCCAAVFRDGKVEIITNSIDKTTTPSVVCFKGNETVFGETAVRAGVVNPENCISEMKRIIGRKYNDNVVQTRMQKWHFRVTSSNGMPAVQVTKGSKSSYKPEEISALVLGEMKRIAEVYLGSKVHDAVVTIPAYFNELQREATKAACVLAGLNVLRMINEPTAAAIAFGLQCESTELRKVMVFDFGGGTCDVSILNIQGKNFTVKASKGDNVLGGEDFDDCLTDHVAQIIERRYRIKIDTSGYRRLRIACENAKKKLSVSTTYELEVDEFMYDGINKIDIKTIIKKSEFESLTYELAQRVLVPVAQCLREANTRKREIDEVVMVGGSSKMPKIQELLKKFFGGKKLNMKINPDEAIAYGAAVQAAVSCGVLKDYRINEITPISLGVGNLTSGRLSIMIRRNTKIPAKFTDTYHTSCDNQDSMKFPVYQGECEEDEFQNTKIGEFTLSGVTLAPAKVTAAYVTFTIDADGILHVEAVEAGRENNKRAITITRRVT